MYNRDFPKRCEKELNEVLILIINSLNGKKSLLAKI